LRLSVTCPLIEGQIFILFTYISNSTGQLNSNIATARKCRF